jgi:prepilin-type N-terminal cleavage/methylation domain-containing protein
MAMVTHQRRPGLPRHHRGFAAAWQDRQGFTLTELLVTMAIMGLVMAALVGVQVSSNTVFATGENQAQAQQAARTAMLMEEDLRLVGYGYPPALTAITGASQTSITFWADLNNVSTTLSTAAAAGAKVLTVVGGAGINPNDTIYLVSGSTSETQTVKTIVGPTITVNSGTGLANAYPAGAVVGRPLAVTYSWAGNTLSKDPGDGTGAQALATGVQAQQFSFFDTTDTAILTTNLSANLANIRRVAITMTAQSTASNPCNARSFTVTTYVRPRNLP